jgi:hypothetical protein
MVEVGQSRGVSVRPTTKLKTLALVTALMETGSHMEALLKQAWTQESPMSLRTQPGGGVVVVVDFAIVVVVFHVF